MSDIDSTNPGTVTVANQGYDFLPRPDQPVTVSVPSTASAINVNVADSKPSGVGVAANVFT